MSEKVFFESGGVKLCGILSDPGSKSVVALFHGFASPLDSSTNMALENSLNEAGIATFRFNFFGHGESGGDLADITVTKGVQNGLDAVKYLKERGYEHIGIEGASYGGYVGYQVASQTPNLFVVALKCPVADWREKCLFDLVNDDLETWRKKGETTMTIGENQQVLKATLAEDCLQSVAYDSLPAIRAPTILIHGDADPVVPLAQSRKAAELIPHCILAVVDGADHQFSDPEHFKKMLSLLTAFIIEHAKK